MPTSLPLGPSTSTTSLVIAHLRDHLPDTHILIHGLDLPHPTTKTPLEAPLLVLTPRALYLADVIPHPGLIAVHDRRWYPQDAQPHLSPLVRLHADAQRLAALLASANPTRHELQHLALIPTIILTGAYARLRDPAGYDLPQVTTLTDAPAYFQSPVHLPPKAPRELTPLLPLILDTLKRRALPRTQARQFGSWVVSARLCGTDKTTDYRAYNSHASARQRQVLLRVHELDDTLEPDARALAMARITNAYQALSRMPSHAGVGGVRDFFQLPGADRFVLVTEDLPARALRLYLEDARLALTFDQKLRIASELLDALAHAHRHEVVHRNLSPSTIVLTADGRPRLTGFDFARAGTERSRSIAGQIIDELDPRYLAPEVHRDPARASAASDMFALGLVLYELFVGERPFSSPTEAGELQAEFPIKPSAQRGELPWGFDQWLQRLCAFEPGGRPGAAQAAAELSALTAPSVGMRADQFMDRYLAACDGELRPLLEVMEREETDWLEFKAGLIPPPGRKGANKADGQFAVVKALLALVNSRGGAVLLAVNDDGDPVSLGLSDPKNYREKEGWDGFARKVLNSALFRPSGWKTQKRGTWTLDVPRFRAQLETRRATLDGQEILALIARPLTPGEPLLVATNELDGQVQSTCFVRRSGDIGMVDKLDDDESSDEWSRKRELHSAQFSALLERVRAAQRGRERTPEHVEVDWHQLPTGFALTSEYVIQRRLGQGSFGVVYEVYDVLADMRRAVKLVTKDRHSVLERLKQEYQTLVRIPEHPNLVRVYSARFPESGHPPPFIVFDYVEGENLAEMITSERLSCEDVLDLARQVVEGLAHLHRHNAYHCDIKPSNLMWASPVRIIDFNVSVMPSADPGHGGGSRRYIPPDLDTSVPPQLSDLADRDLFALGVTLYEAIANGYPWDASSPPPGIAARPLSPQLRLSPEFEAAILKAISPRRGQRFSDADELRAALERIERARLPAPSTISSASLEDRDDSPNTRGPQDAPPNQNPFVSQLVTLYSQSGRSNMGTRGLESSGPSTYVETALDRELTPAILAGEFRLVVITGNAGDGKTAFLQRLELQATDSQAQFEFARANGRRFRLAGRNFTTNYDGSQDEGEQTNPAVLRAFFAPYAGDDPSTWAEDEIRLIAINEGRLVDFLAAEREHFPALERSISAALARQTPSAGVAVVNLNLRSVMANTDDHDADDPEHDQSIFARTLRRLTHERLWEPCHRCDLRDRCYAFHNARSFQDTVAGPALQQRLAGLYLLTHLRGRLHVTLRDLRSALAFMLVSDRDCEEIHALYAAGDRHREAIAQSFYFNSWMGGDQSSADRLLTLLAEVDVGEASDPRLDRKLGFVAPSDERELFRFDDRGRYDRDVLQYLFEHLPRDFSGRPSSERARTHRRYLAMARRRVFFERRDPGWRRMLPYRAAAQMQALLRGKGSLCATKATMLEAINRAEGIHESGRLDGALALLVRRVERGTLRSYRVFPAERFSLEIVDPAPNARFVEHRPAGLVLCYRGPTGVVAELLINLDVFEMLTRLAQGYRPSVEEEQGYFLSVAVFKNVLGSEPYQEVLLTTTGHDFYRVTRHEGGQLELSEMDSHGGSG